MSAEENKCNCCEAIQLVNMLRLIKMKYFHCKKCKKFLTHPSRICLFETCGHQFCRACIYTLQRDNGTVVCSVCKEVQTVYNLLMPQASYNIFRYTKRRFYGLVVDIYKRFYSIGNQEIVNALVAAKLYPRLGMIHNNSTSPVTLPSM